MELFTNADMLEVETLGPLTTLAPGAAVTHTELWTLVAGAPQPATEEDVVERVMPVISKSIHTVNS